ncbi:cytochrome b-245 chaperone 1 isoform X2 [Erinaceus europaeus]|uniref:Essential for reactive oxygen species protein n=1 Tax=Erinaceus europaeus TaxID=9365 RepID=A0A1S3WCX7_ERIEU|nr:cytochrome b-245 chaperone 1 isoform X2 [Erinaceus europaeus]
MWWQDAMPLFLGQSLYSRYIREDIIVLLHCPWRFPCVSRLVMEAIFNKSTGKVILKTSSLYRKLLTLSRAGHEQVVVMLNDIRDVNVEEEKVRYFGKGYVVVLRFATGFSHPLTQSAVMGHRSDVEAIAKLIISFLELHRLESPLELSQSSDSGAEGPDSQS